MQTRSAARRAFANDAHLRIAPEVESRSAVEMLLADVHAARIADLAVDDGDLAMVAVADRVQMPQRRGRRHSDARRLHVLDIGAVQMGVGSQRIIEQPHLDSRPRLLAQDLFQLFGEHRPRAK